MKLLLISVKSDSSAGGIAVWTEYFLSYCQQERIDCHLVNTKIIGRRNHTGKRRLWDELVRTSRIRKNLKKHLKHNAYDVVYLNTSCGTFGLFRDAWLARLVHKKHIPLITHYHCEIPFWIKKKSRIRTLGSMARISQRNLVLCQNSQNFLKEHYGTVADKVPNFVKTELVRTMLKPIDGPVKEVVFLGYITESKGATELFSIAQRLPHIHFTLIGAVNSSVDLRLKPDNITLTGYLPQEQTIPYLDRADVFLFPSHTEGCSMALMEAMARGLPAIATDTGANAELMADGCGVVVPCHDVDNMITALQQLDDATIRQSISTKAVERIRLNYTDNNIFQIYKNILHH